MENSVRAKQFIPFAALKGYEEALRKKERIVIEKSTLSEEYQEELDRKMRDVVLGEIVTICYYNQGEYIKKTGMVSRIDINARIIKLVQTKISFDDIFDIEHQFTLENGVNP